MARILPGAERGLIADERLVHELADRLVLALRERDAELLHLVASGLDPPHVAEHAHAADRSEPAGELNLDRHADARLLVLVLDAAARIGHVTHRALLEDLPDL